MTLGMLQGSAESAEHQRSDGCYIRVVKSAQSGPQLRLNMCPSNGCCADET
jgi:hypothetical protein